MDPASSFASPVSGPGVDGSVDLAVEFAHVVGVEDLDVCSLGSESVLGIAAFIGLRSLHLVEDLGHSLLVSGEVVFVSIVGVKDSVQVHFDDLKSAHSLKAEFEAGTLDGFISGKGDGGLTAADEEIRKSVVAGVWKVVKRLAIFFFVFSGSSSSCAIGSAEVEFITVSFDCDLIPAADVVFLDIKGVGDDVEASNVSEIDVPLAVEPVVVVASIEARRVDDRLGISDSSSAFSIVGAGRA